MKATMETDAELVWIQEPAAVHAWLRLPAAPRESSDGEVEESEILVRVSEIRGVCPLGKSHGTELLLDRRYARTSAAPEEVKLLIARAAKGPKIVNGGKP